MTGEEHARQRHGRPPNGSGQTLISRAGVGAVQCGSYCRRVRHPIAAGLWFLFAATLVWPMFDGAGQMKGVGFGVFAAPCVTGNATAGERTVSVLVNPTTGLNLTMFNCEGGAFEVFWSGNVTVPGTIHIGLGTTVHIMGDTSLTDTSGAVSTAESSSNISGGGVDDLTAALAIPRGLTAAAVGVAPSDISRNESIPFGPILFVDGGQLFLENIAIRGGYVTNSTDFPAASGGGIYAYQSNITVTSCVFEDNFAEFAGGGIFANESTLVAVNSVFKRCQAGLQAEVGDDVDDKGGGINCENTDALIHGCLFEKCYTSKKGGGMHHGGGGKMTVLNSVFYNNSAGSNNEQDEDEVGEGAALAISTCEFSFDSLGGCDVYDTVFVDNHAGRKGGAVSVGSGNRPSRVEFHRCRVANSTTGKFIEDDPQGEGGVFNLGAGTQLLLSDSVFEQNYCGNKGGVIAMSSGSDWDDDPGATVILRNSMFDKNTAEGGSAGVVSVEKFGALVVEGDGNVFKGNVCGENGGVFGGTTNTNITVEGGVFTDNFADSLGPWWDTDTFDNVNFEVSPMNRYGREGGVIWTKDTVDILGGLFVDNRADNTGGVIMAGDESITHLTGGEYQGNRASDGGVVYVGSGAELFVSGDTFSENEASNFGGAFFVGEDGILKITGGTFTKNEADFGGFLYKEGEGDVSCVGALIEECEGVDGGAIYAVEDAVLDWACDLIGNIALAGPAIYARDDTTVILRGISLVDNTVARGAAVFVTESNLETYQVLFNDSTESSDLSAVQVDKKSSYKAEDTSFVGFQGEAVVFSEGKLFLDDCDFSGSTASQLVYSEPDSTVVIRNTVLGDNNYLALAEASSVAGTLPTADSLTNAIVTCQDLVDGADSSSSDSSDPFAICSEDSACLQGDLGVYCECYMQISTMEQRCVSGGATTLDLDGVRPPVETFFPIMLEGDLMLSHRASAASSDVPSTTDTAGSLSETGSSSTTSTISSTSSTSTTSTSSTSTSDGGDGEDDEESGVVLRHGGQSGVIWNVSALPQLSQSGTSMMDWTIFPSSGLLLPGESINLRVVTLPSSGFDGNASVTFEAIGIGSTVASSTTFDVTFFHCAIGEVWSGTSSIFDSADGDPTEACKLCGDVVEGETRGVECDEPGATIHALPVDPGFWRAALNATFIRECSNEVCLTAVTAAVDCCDGSSSA